MEKGHIILHTITHTPDLTIGQITIMKGKGLTNRIIISTEINPPMTTITLPIDTGLTQTTEKERDMNPTIERVHQPNLEIIHTIDIIIDPTAILEIGSQAEIDITQDLAPLQGTPTETEEMTGAEIDLLIVTLMTIQHKKEIKATLTIETTLSIERDPTPMKGKTDLEAKIIALILRQLRDRPTESQEKAAMSNVSLTKDFLIPHLNHANRQ